MLQLHGLESEISRIAYMYNVCNKKCNRHTLVDRVPIHGPENGTFSCAVKWLVEAERLHVTASETQCVFLF